jgi:hypothetical protein
MLRVTCRATFFWSRSPSRKAPRRPVAINKAFLRHDGFCERRGLSASERENVVEQPNRSSGPKHCPLPSEFRYGRQRRAFPVAIIRPSL